MGRAWLIGIGLGLMVAQAAAQELERYLHLRRLHKVQGLTPVGALELSVGKRVLEVEGVVRGSVAVETQRSILLEVEPTRTLVIQISEPDRWLTNGQFRIRALVQVVRESALVTPDYRLIGAVPASVFARYEAEERARPQPPSRPSAQSQTPRTSPPARGKSLASRGAHSQAPTITDWQSFAANLELYVPYYYQAIRQFNPRLPAQQAEQIARAILRFSAHYGVDPRFIMAIVLVESGFNPNATSRKGAMGLGQLMPGTARGLGVVDPYDPIQNLAGTVRLVRGHLERYWQQVGGDPNTWEHVVLALAAYNAGSGAVRKHGGVPPYKETQNYIRKVIAVYKRLCGLKS
ncbi:Endo-type membrane-bound lytic murein transglycosylase A [bacterium HR15]|nr:Endo-type membrane-bound lytic murein transglycosylase A [bacterium HR15]